MEEVFYELDERATKLAEASDRDGCTATVAAINRNHLILGSTGDCTALLCR